MANWIVGNSLPAVSATGNLLKLNNGKMLLISGEHLANDNSGDNAVYLFDPNTNLWSTVASRSNSNTLFGSTILQNGKVLTAGGQSTSSTFSACEIYDPVGNTWTPTGSLNTARAGVVLVTLNDGTVLAVGGVDVGSSTYYNTCEIYDPNTQIWSFTGNLPEPKAYASVALLLDGRVLASGGDQNGTTTGAQAATFNMGVWTAQNTGYVGTSTSFNGQNTAILSNGIVFNLGGAGQGGGSFTAYCESFNPVTNTWTRTADMPFIRAWGACFTLPNDTILCAGGTTSGDVAQSDSWIYDPVGNTWTQTINLNAPRSYNYTNQGVIPITNDNRCILAAGRTNPNSTAILNSVDIYLFSTSFNLTKLDTNQIFDNSITSSKIAVGAVGTEQIANGSILSTQIASGQVVKSVNGLFDSVVLAPGSNITITPSGQTLTIASTGSGSGTVNSGTAGRLSLYDTSSNAVSDTYVQNSHNITVAIATQGSRSTDLALTIPNPGDGVSTSNIVLDQSTNTLTNKRITLRVETLTDAATVTPSTDNADGGILTSLSQTTLISNPTGTPTDMQTYFLRIKSSSAQTLTWGNIFRDNGVLTLPTVTSGSNKTDYVGFRYDITSNTWDLLSVNFGFVEPGPSFSFNRSLTIDHTKVGTVDNTDQTNFPVLVSITDPTFKTVGNGGHVQNSSGFDIVFSSNSGNTSPLFWEMESYDPVNGVIVAWVQIPTVSHTSDTVFYMFYGNASISTFQSVASSVWDSNFKGVYHLTNLTAESTINNITATNHGGTTIAGEIAGGLALDGVSQYETAGTTSDFNLTTNGTVSCWFFITNGAIGRQTLFSKDNFNTDRNGFLFYINSDITMLGFELANGSSFDQGEENTALATQNTWHHAVLTWDSTTVNIYIDGVNDFSNPQTVVPVSNVLTLTLGRRAEVAGDFFAGTLDEMRLSNTARTADWVKTEYNNQNSPSTFITVGSEM